MDREIGLLDGDLQDISDALERAVEESTDDDRIVMTKAQASTFLQSFNELWDEVSEQSESPQKNKPIFLHVAKPSELYLQAAAIALVVFDRAGNAALNMVNGSNIAIEAFQWQKMKAHFLESVTLLEVESTGGLVKA